MPTSHRGGPSQPPEPPIPRSIRHGDASRARKRMTTNEELLSAHDAAREASRIGFHPHDHEVVAKAAVDARAAVLARMAPEWRPIESAPRDGTSILTADSDGGMYVVDWCETLNESAKASGHCWWGTEGSGRYGFHTSAFTHWMPLPAPPATPSPPA